MAENLTLESPVVQEARNRFDKSKYHVHYKAQFDDLRSCFEKGYTYELAGWLCGLPHSAPEIGQMFGRYFRSVCAIKDGLERRRKRSKERRARILKDLEYMLPQKKCLTRIVLEMARLEGCSVELLPRKHVRNIKPVLTMLRINGLLCSLQRKPLENCNNFVSLSRKTAEAVDVHILLLPSPEGGQDIYLVPSMIMFNARFENTKDLFTHIVTPASTMPRICSHANPCIRGYKNAWWVVGQLTRGTRAD